MKKTVIAITLASTAMYLWGFIFWVMTELPFNAIKQVHNDLPVAKTLNQIFPESGTYQIPDHRNGNTDQQIYWESLAEHGPVVTVHIQTEGISKFQLDYQLLFGYLHIFIAVIIMSLLLKKCSSALPSYGSRLGFVSTIGLLGSYFYQLDWIIWFHHPPELFLYQLFYHSVSWLVCGLVLAGLLKPENNVSTAVATEQPRSQAPVIEHKKLLPGNTTTS